VPGASEIVVSLVYLNLTTIIDVVLELPFTVYQTFVIEQTHGFNTQTVGNPILLMSTTATPLSTR
jgi:hypothetical protein